VHAQFAVSGVHDELLPYLLLEPAGFQSILPDKSMIRRASGALDVVNVALSSPATTSSARTPAVMEKDNIRPVMIKTKKIFFISMAFLPDNQEMFINNLCLPG
jgi:hypothetical protein